MTHVTHEWTVVLLCLLDINHGQLCRHIIQCINGDTFLETHFHPHFCLGENQKRTHVSRVTNNTQKSIKRPLSQVSPMYARQRTYHIQRHEQQPNTARVSVVRHSQRWYMRCFGDRRWATIEIGLNSKREKKCYPSLKYNEMLAKDQRLARIASADNNQQYNKLLILLCFWYVS